MSNIADQLTQALRTAPELNTSPTLALAAAQDPTDPIGTAQALAQTSNLNGVSQASDQMAAKAGGPDLFHKTLGWLGGSLHTVAHAVQSIPGVQPAERAVGAGLNMASAPLREVQHDFRYLHDVEARHGPLAALLEAVPIVTAGAVGAYLGGNSGAIAGGELAASVEGRIAYKDSFARTATGADYQGHYDRGTGQYMGPKGDVSIGRDLAAGVFREQPGSAPYKITSAIADGIADLTLDPLVVAGGALSAARSAEGAGGLVGTTFSRAPQGATDALRAVDLETRVANLPEVNRAFTEIAGITSPTEIALRYPKFDALAPKLAQAGTKDAVVDVFRQALMSTELSTNVMPSMTFTRIPFAKLQVALRQYDGTGSGLIRAETSLLPTYFDAETGKLSNKAFNLGDSRAIRGVYNVMRFSQSDAVARTVADEFANAIDDPGRQILIYKNGIRDMLVAKGLPEDHPFVMKTVDELAQRAMGGGEAFYGADMTGRNLSKVATEAGSSSLGILMSQQGKLAFPDFSAVVREARNLGTYKQYYGAADDWIYNKYTQGVFKRLVLLSGGFAQRIAAAEAIPAALREGVGNIVRSRLAASAAKDMSDEELGSLSAAVSHVMGGANKLVGDADKTDFVVNMMHDNGGHIVADAIDTGTPSAEFGNPAERARRTMYVAYKQVPGRNVLSANQFGMFGRDQIEHNADTWARWLSPISNDEASQKAARAYLSAMQGGATMDAATTAGAAAAKEWLDAQPATVINRMGRHFALPPGAEGVDPHEQWARTIIENVKGATHSPTILDDAGNVVTTGAPHMSLLRNVADGVQTRVDDLEQIPHELRPLVMPGRKLLPDTTGTIERIANVGFKKVLDPIINFLSREPLYVNEAYDQYKYLKPLVDSGDMLVEDARQLAQTRAVVNVLPFIHNTLERSQFSSLARNYMPFWFAQEQAYKRVGRLYADDPGAFRKFQLMISGLHEAGSTHSDPNGNSYLIYPGAGFLSGATTKVLSGFGIPIGGSVPVSFSGQLKSLNTVFPFAEGIRPNFGPVVSIPSHLIENLFPELSPLVHDTIGDQAASGSIYDQVIPNQTLKSLVQTLDPSQRSRSMQNATIATVQALVYQQERQMKAWTDAGNDPNSPNAPRIPGASPDDLPQERQALIDRIKNQTRITFMFKTLLGAVTPAAPVVNVGDWGLKQEMQDLIKKEGVTAAVPDFLAKHPDATPYTVFYSQNNAGAPIPATESGQQWINDNMAFLHKYPNAGAWFVPQDAGQFSQGVYNEQLAQHLREHKSPEQVMNDLYVAAGNDQFYNRDLPDYHAQLDAAQASGNTQLASQIQAGFSKYISTVLGPQNPVWWDNLSSADRDHNRQIAVQQMQQMFASGDVPNSPQTTDLGSLVVDFTNYTQEKADAARNPNVTAAQVKAGWQNYLTQLEAQKPNLAPVIRSIFMSL